MWNLGLVRAKELQILNEDNAVELGANILGEIVIFSFTAAIIYFKYQKPSIKRRLKEEDRQKEVSALQESISELHLAIEVQSSEIRQLQRTVWDLR